MFAAFPLLALPVLAYNLIALTVAGGFAGDGAPGRRNCSRSAPLPAPNGRSAWGIFCSPALWSCCLSNC
jgi:hypothetical protein